MAAIATIIRPLDWNQGTDRLLAVRRCHLRNLRVLRGWHTVPRNDHGRGMLAAMLACGVSVFDVGRVAPWATSKDLTVFMKRSPVLPDGQELGTLVGLTDAERERNRRMLWSLRPCDVAWDDVQERNASRSAERRRARLEKARMEMDDRLAEARETLSLRAIVVLAHIGPKWTTVEQIRRKVVSSPCFQPKWKPGGNIRAMPPETLGRVIRRLVSELAAGGLIQTEKRADEQRVTTFLRLVTAKNQGSKPSVRVNSALDIQSSI